MPHPLHVPERSVVAELHRIDRDLSVDWVEPPGRWGVFYALQVDGNFDESVDRLARELQHDAWTMGYCWSYEDCAQTAVNALKARTLVCYVVNDDGGYRSLDGRIVEKIKRLDWQRQNCELRDWKQLMDARADAVRRSREVAAGDVWDTIRRDRVFSRHVSDILWGMRPIRSVIVPEGVPDAHDNQRHESGPVGQSAGAEAHGAGQYGSGVALSDHAHSPAEADSGK